MKLVDSKLGLLIAALFLPLLFFPKINLIQFEGETAGIRIDDLLLFGLSLLLLWIFSLKNRSLSRIETGIVLITLSSLLSFAIGRFLFTFGYLAVTPKIYYALRPIEYFLFFYIGAISFRHFRLEGVLLSFFLFNLVLMLLQKFALLGKLTSLGDNSLTSSRVTGIASFPSEMGALLSMLFAFFLFQTDVRRRLHLPPALRKFASESKPLLLLALFSFFTLLTGARIALAAIIFVFFASLMASKKRLILLLPLTLLAFAAIPFLYLYPPEAFSRYSHLLSLANFQIIPNVWHSINTEIDMYENIQLISDNYDLSWWIRLHKWCYTLKLYVTHPECWLQGLGPGVSSAALDGGFLRILTESGLIGLLLYAGFFRNIARQSTQLKWVVIAFLFNMIFFDVYLAYKPMALLLLLSGYRFAESADPSFSQLGPLKSKKLDCSI